MLPCSAHTHTYTHSLSHTHTHTHTHARTNTHTHTHKHTHTHTNTGLKQALHVMRGEGETSYSNTSCHLHTKHAGICLPCSHPLGYSLLWEMGACARTCHGLQHPAQHVCSSTNRRHCCWNPTSSPELQRWNCPWQSTHTTAAAAAAASCSAARLRTWFGRAVGNPICRSST